MKKPALLLSLFMVLLALPAHAAMIIDDHFTGSSLSPAWEKTYGGSAYSWQASVSASHLRVRKIYLSSNDYWGYVYLSQQFDPIGDFTATFEFDWEEYNLRTMRSFGIQLMDSDHNRVAGIYANDTSPYNSGGILAAYGDSSSSYGGLPFIGSGTASIIRTDDVINYYWNDNLITSTTLLDQVTTFELMFSFYKWPNGELDYVNIDRVTLEGDPVDLSATPEPGTMMLLGSALGLGAWWHRRRKSNKHIQA